MTVGKMKNSWLSTLTITLVIGLLTLFLGLQYNWLVQASSAEKERMQKRVEADAKNFGTDFNREIQGAFFNFQSDPELISKGDYSEIVARYEHWRKNSEFPTLIKEILYFAKSGAETRALRFDPENNTLKPADFDERTAGLAKFIASSRRPGPVFEEQLALIVPVYGSERRLERIMLQRSAAPPIPEREPPFPAGYFAILLDEQVLKAEMLPTYASRHFQGSDFGITVSDREGRPVYGTAEPVENPDASTPLFDLSPDNLIFFASRELLPPKEAIPNGDVAVSHRVEKRIIDPAQEKGEVFTIQVKGSGEGQRTAVVSNTESVPAFWKLNVRHNAGSLDRYISKSVNQSFLWGLAVYFLLVGSILAIVLSSMRARAFAQRQVDFVSSVSHEFRTPLAVIYSAAENLADGVASDGRQVVKYGDLIKAEGKKLSAMVEQILEFAGARSGRKKYNLSNASVTEPVENAVTACEPMLLEAGFAVERDISNALPETKIDRDAIEAAVRNLIQNSIKYSNGTRWIRISANHGGGAVRISVEDRGLGISAADRKKIFDPFFRARTVVDAQIHGNGLGLPLVKEIAEAHGGRVDVSTELGKGSRFTIELPVE